MNALERHNALLSGITLDSAVCSSLADRLWLIVLSDPKRRICPHS